MDSLRTRDWQALLGLAAEVVECDELPAVAATVQDGVGRLVGCDIPSCHELTIGHDVMARGGGSERYPSWVSGQYLSLAHQNPLLAHHLRTGDRSALRLSDFISLPRLHRLELYQSTYRPVGIEHQLSFAFALSAPGHSPERLVRLSLSRQSTDFTERDRAIMNKLQPFAQRAYRDAFIRAKVSTADPGAPALNDDHRPELRLTEREHEVLARVRTGETNARIAAEMKISRHTVAKHLQHIYTKLGVTNRTTALRRVGDPG